MRYFALLCCLGLTAFTEAPPERLQCAAVYGLMAAGDPSPRADAAQSARAILTETATAADVQTYDDAAVADRDAGRLNPDEMAGACDKAFRFKVAEASGQPYQPKSQTFGDWLHQTPAGPEVHTTSSASFLYGSCNGGKRGFDAGLSREDLERTARAQGCTENDIKALLLTRDFLVGN